MENCAVMSHAICFTKAFICWSLCSILIVTFPGAFTYKTFTPSLGKSSTFNQRNMVSSPFSSQWTPSHLQWVIPEKNPHPHDGRHVFLTPPPTWISKTAWPPLPSGFPSSKTPPPIWISIKLLDTVILIYPQCRRILLSTWMIFSLNKSRFSVNSVFVVKVKIPFSHLLKQA